MADRSDYPSFVAACWTRLLRTAYLLVQDWPTAEDLTQAALVKAWLAWPRLDGDPEAYVRKIIVTTHVSWWRRRWRRSEMTTGQPPERPGAASEMDAIDDRDAVWRALGRLPPGQRAVVVLRFFEDLTEAQVAGILGCSAGTVKSQTSRALVAAALSVANFAHEHASGQGVISGVQQFPAAFTASDGASYRRVAVTSMPESARQSATITVRVGSYPVDVMAACDAPRSVAAVAVKVNGVVAAAVGCPGPPQLTGLSVRPGRRADITFIKMPIMTGAPKINANWRFAVYEWKPPATARPAPPVPQMPVSYTGNNTTTGHGKTLRREIASRSGDWPGDRTATFTVTYHGRNLDISLACSGAIAGRLQVTTLVDGHKASEVPCTSWTPGNPPPDNGGFSGRPGIPDTLTFRIQAPSPYTAAAYAARAASWTISIYEEEF